MSDNLLEKAKVLCESLPTEDVEYDLKQVRIISGKSEDVMKHIDFVMKMANMFPDLVAEIKRLRADNQFLHQIVDAPGSTLEAEIDAVKRLQEQEDDGGNLTIAYMLGSHDANERLKVLQAYVKRLEEAFMAEVKRRNLDNPMWLSEDNQERHAEKDARDALERIRHAEEIHG